MKQEDNVRITASAFVYASSKDGGHLDSVAYHDGAMAEYQFWQTKIKEKDEEIARWKERQEYLEDKMYDMYDLLDEMAEALRLSNQAENYERNTAILNKYKKIQPDDSL